MVLILKSRTSESQIYLNTKQPCLEYKSHNLQERIVEFLRFAFCLRRFVHLVYVHNCKMIFKTQKNFTYLKIQTWVICIIEKHTIYWAIAVSVYATLSAGTISLSLGTMSSELQQMHTEFPE